MDDAIDFGRGDALVELFISLGVDVLNGAPLLDTAETTDSKNTEKI